MKRTSRGQHLDVCEDASAERIRRAADAWAAREDDLTDVTAAYVRFMGRRHARRARRWTTRCAQVAGATVLAASAIAWAGPALHWTASLVTQTVHGVMQHGGARGSAAAKAPTRIAQAGNADDGAGNMRAKLGSNDAANGAVSGVFDGLAKDEVGVSSSGSVEEALPRAPAASLDGRSVPKLRRRTAPMARPGTPLPVRSPPSFESTPWADAARALHAGDYASAERSFDALAHSSDAAMRDNGRIARARLWLSEGRRAEARRELQDLAQSGATLLVRQLASDTLRSFQ